MKKNSDKRYVGRNNGGGKKLPRCNKARMAYHSLSSMGVAQHLTSVNFAASKCILMSTYIIHHEVGRRLTCAVFQPDSWNVKGGCSKILTLGNADFSRYFVVPRNLGYPEYPGGRSGFILPLRHSVPASGVLHAGIPGS